MSKGKNPFFSLGAQGSVGDCLTVRHTRGVDVLEKKPFPTDPQSLAQIYQRWDYQNYVTQWNALLPISKRTWHSNATRFHMTGFAYFMSYHLKNLPDLAARYHLDERGGALALDTSRNLNHGTVFGALPTSGIIDYARTFDGVDDLIHVPYDPSLNLIAAFTIFIFFNQIAWPVDWPVYITRGRNYLIQGGTAAIKLITGFFHDGTAWRSSGNTGLNSITPGKWQSCALRYWGPQLAIFLDGEFKNAGMFPGLRPQNVTTNLTIGRDTPIARHLNAIVDEVIIYNRGLTNEEIARLNERRYP